MKKIIFIALLSLTFTLTSFNSPKNESILISNQDDDFVYDFVEEMPSFPGGEEGLNKYITDHLVYPKRLKKEGVGGKVFVSAIIEKDGEVTHETAYQGINKKLEYEALKLVQGMPNWIPGKNKGKVVRVKVVIPVEFK
jgi:protein TonB